MDEDDSSSISTSSSSDDGAGRAGGADARRRQVLRANVSGFADGLLEEQGGVCALTGGELGEDPEVDHVLEVAIVAAAWTSAKARAGGGAWEKTLARLVSGIVNSRVNLRLLSRAAHVRKRCAEWARRIARPRAPRTYHAPPHLISAVFALVRRELEPALARGTATTRAATFIAEGDDSWFSAVAMDSRRVLRCLAALPLGEVPRAQREAARHALGLVVGTLSSLFSDEAGVA